MSTAIKQFSFTLIMPAANCTVYSTGGCLLRGINNNIVCTSESVIQATKNSIIANSIQLQEAQIYMCPCICGSPSRSVHLGEHIYL